MIEFDVKRVAESRGFKTPAELARATGLAYVTVWQLWGKPTPPTIWTSTLDKLCEALRAQPAELMYHVPANGKRSRTKRERRMSRATAAMRKRAVETER
jgi:DNA-binding Xre family transcriptional regulator